MDTIAIELNAHQIEIVKRNSLMESEIKGQIENMFISFSHGRYILKGSIQKFVLGNNYENPSWMIVDRFLFKMKKLYGLDLRDSNIYRMDIGVVIPCSEIPNVLSSIIELNARYSKKIFSKKHSLLFYNRSMGLALYDKTNELNDEIYHPSGERLLRVELRAFKRASCKRLGVYNLNDLRNEKNHHALRKKLVEMVEGLKWYNSFKIQDLRTNRSMMAFLFKYYLDEFGYENFFHVLEDHRLSKLITKSQKSEFRKSVLRMISATKYQKLERRKKLLRSMEVITE